MKLAPRLARYGLTPLLLGGGIGLTLYLCLVIDRLQEARAADRARIDATAAGLLIQGRSAEAERRQLHGDILRHQRWAEERWVELDGRLRRIEAAVEAVGADGGGGEGAP